MNCRIEMICVVNPDQFKWRNLLESYFETVEINMGYVDVESHLVDSIINRDIAEEFSRDMDDVKTLYLTDDEDQTMFNWILDRYSGHLKFLLQDGKLYRYGEILVLLKDDLKRVVWERSNVTFTEYELIYKS